MRDERGFMLIEVLVSAIILVTASLAIFATLDRANAAAGNQQIRVEAANFSQSELERIRSLPVEDVMQFAADGTRTVKRNGINFKETVVAKWVSDGDDEPECTGQDGGLDYMRTSVTISWPGMDSIRPVTLTSLYTPNAGAGGNTGSISVHVIDRDGAPVPFIPVSIVGENGGGSYSGTTNKNGCVVFGFIAQDTYDLTAKKDNYVDQDSNPQITDKVVVTAATTSKVEYTYDVGGTTKVAFTAKWNPAGILGSLIGQATVPSYPQHFQIWHAQQTAPGGFDVDLPQNAAPPYKGPTAPVVYPTTANEASSWDGRATVPQTLLFPFTSPYSVYAGTCPSNAVATTSPGFQVNIARNAFINTGTQNMTTLQVIVYNGSAPGILTQGNLVGGARVMVSFGCPGAWTRITAKSTGDPNPGQGGSPDSSPWGVGTLADPGFPSSPNMRVCVFDPTNGHYTQTYAATNTNPSLTTNTLTIYTNATGKWTSSPPTGAPAGSCMAS